MSNRIFGKTPKEHLAALGKQMAEEQKPSREENIKEWTTRFQSLMNAARYQVLNKGKMSEKVALGILWMLWVKERAFETGDPDLDADLN